MALNMRPSASRALPAGPSREWRFHNLNPRSRLHLSVVNVPFYSDPFAAQSAFMYASMWPHCQWITTPVEGAASPSGGEDLDMGASPPFGLAPSIVPGIRSGASRDAFEPLHNKHKRMYNCCNLPISSTDVGRTFPRRPEIPGSTSSQLANLNSLGCAF